ERRGVRRARARPFDPGARRVRTPPAAVRRGSPCRLPAGRAHSRAVQARPRGRVLRRTAAGPGTVDQAGGRLAPGQPGAGRSRRGDRGRAHLHDAARRPGERLVHPDASAVELAGGSRLGYEALVLATGSAPRRLPIPGAESALTLRNRADSDAIRESFGEGNRLVIVGGGWIGLEVAAAARDKGT